MSTFHRLFVIPLGGEGSAVILPEPNYGFIEAGTLVSLTWNPFGGYTFVGWYLNGSLISTQQSNYIFTMPTSDVYLIAQMAGQANPVIEYGDYGLKYLFDWDRPRMGNYRIEISQLGYTGSSSTQRISGVSFSFGNFGGHKPTDILDTVIGSRLEMKVASRIASSIYYDDLIDLNPRKFRVKFFIGYNAGNPSNSDFQWTGYLMMDVFSRPENDLNYITTLVATDGLNSLDSTRIIPDLFSGWRANQVLAGLLNQTMINPRLPLKAVTEVWETRMNKNDSVWNQFSLNNTRFIETTKAVKYNSKGYEINPYVKIKTGLEYILRSFQCRVFQWQNEWVILRVPDLKKAAFYQASISNVGTQTSYVSVTNHQQHQHNVYNATKLGCLAYNEYALDLQLGNVDVPNINSVLIEPMENDSWVNYGGAQYYLVKWEYINAQYFDGVRDSNICRIERVTNPTSGENGQFARFWGTANTLGDPLMSSIVYKSFNQNRPNIATETANKISISCKYQILRRGTSDPLNPVAGSHKVCFSLKIGTKWLYQVNSTTFDWTSTPTIVALDPRPSGVFHSITLTGIDVPESGDVEFYLYQLVTIFGTRHRYVIDWEDVKIDIEQNSDISNEALELVAISDSPFANEFPKIDHFIGDSFTNLSASAIKLVNFSNGVSELWTRDSIEAERLQYIAIREMVNLFSKSNYRLQGVVKHMIRPDRAFEYDSKKWIINAFKFNDDDELFEVDLFNLD